MKDIKASLIKLTTLPETFDLNTVKTYFNEIYNSVTKRSYNDLDFYCFHEIIRLPLFISQKIFYFLSGNEHVLIKSLFSDGLSLMYYGTQSERVNLLFRVLDFDNDNRITIDDTKQFFSYLHMINHTYKTLKMLFEIIDNFFEVETMMDKSDFEWKSNYKNFDLVMLFLQFIHNNRFYSENQLVYYSQLRLKDSKEKHISNQMEFVNLSKKLQNYILIIVKNSPRENIKDIEVIEEDYKDMEELEDFENELVDTMSNFERTSPLTRRNIREKEEEDDSFYDDEYNDLTPDNNKKRKSNSSKFSTFFMSKNTKIRAFSYFETYSRNRIDSNDSICESKNNIKLEPNEIILYSIKQSNYLQKIKLTLISNALFLYIWNTDYSKFTFQTIIYLNSTYPEIKDKIQIEDRIYFGMHLISTFHNSLFTLSFYCKNQDNLKSFFSLINSTLKLRRIEDDYSFQNEIGRGKFGVVRLGLCKKNNNHVAIKTVNKFDKAATEEDYKIFQWEKAIFSFLINAKHPNVVRAIDIYETNSNIYYITEYISGGDLKSFVNNGKMTAQKLVSFSFQLINGLNFLHTFGILHRDIKHTNILISKSKNGDTILKYIDFGLGRIIGKTEHNNSPYGSLSFKAPEILLKKDYNSKTDIWSAGITIYFIAFQTLPFSDKSRDKLIEKIICAGYSFPSIQDNIRGNCDYSFVYSLINDCLIKDFQNRLDSKGLMKKYFVNFRTSGDWL